MKSPGNWVRHKQFEGILPISKRHWIQYYIPETSGRSIWITKINEHRYRLHLYTHREHYETLEEAEKAAQEWMS